MTDIDKLIEDHPLPWTTRTDFADVVSIIDARHNRVSVAMIGWGTPSLAVALANALHAEREKVAAMLAEADRDLQHDPAHVEPGPHPSPRFGPASRPSATDRLDAIERRLAALELRNGPSESP